MKLCISLYYAFLNIIISFLGFLYHYLYTFLFVRQLLAQIYKGKIVINQGKNKKCRSNVCNVANNTQGHSD